MNVRLSEIWYDETMMQLVEKLDESAMNGRSWIAESIEKTAVVITSRKWLNHRKGHGHGDVKIPKALKTKKAAINLKGVPERECFKYSVLTTIYRDRFPSSKQALTKNTNDY